MPRGILGTGGIVGEATALSLEPVEKVDEPKGVIEGLWTEVCPEVKEELPAWSMCWRAGGGEIAVAWRTGRRWEIRGVVEPEEC